MDAQEEHRSKGHAKTPWLAHTTEVSPMKRRLHSSTKNKKAAISRDTLREIKFSLKTFCHLELSSCVSSSWDATKWDIGLETLNWCAKGNEDKLQERELFINRTV